MVSKVVIDVTQNDIDNARAAASAPGYMVLEHCAVARAASRVANEPVYTGGILVKRVSDDEPLYALPARAMGWINRFDAHKDVKPTRFIGKTFIDDNERNS